MANNSQPGMINSPYFSFPGSDDNEGAISPPGYNPAASSSSSSSGSAGTPNSPNSDPTPPDLQMDLELVPLWLPSTAGGSSSGSSSGSGQSATLPPGAAFRIDLGSMRDTIQGMINVSAQVVDAYESVKARFENEKDFVYGQYMTDELNPSATGGGGPVVGGGGPVEAIPSGTMPISYTADPIATGAADFAYGSDGKPGMNDAIAGALLQTANAVEAVGQLMALMNAAGYSYAQTDFNSALPPDLDSSNGRGSAS